MTACDGMSHAGRTFFQDGCLGSGMEAETVVTTAKWSGKSVGRADGNRAVLIHDLRLLSTISVSFALR